MTDLILSTARTEDYAALLALNDDAVPHVNSIGMEKLAHLHRQSAHFGVARSDDGSVAAFLLALAETADYDSLNFRWFRDHYPRFVYIDRIVVGAAARRRGVGAALYGDLMRHVPDDCPLLTCEVNLRPPNDQSMAFHRQLGFEPVGQQDTEGGNKTVCLLARRLVRREPADLGTDRQTAG